VTDVAERLDTSYTLQDSSERILPPPLKWAGGKRWLLSTLAPLFEKYRDKRLVEPFAGGMAVTLGLLPERALVNDINPHLINFYSQIRQGLQIADEELVNERDFYFKQRDLFNSLIESGEANTPRAAVLFYYLNRTGFNGLCRFNSRGLFNVPFGRYKTINYIRDFNNYTRRLKRWTFECRDFERLAIQSNDFLYVDPPYDVEFTKYSKEDFAWADQERLVAWLLSLKVPMAISNQATPRILDLHSKAGFTIHTVSAPRRISCTGNREPALEMLATRNLG
jgi:DNA adenine methylase